MKTNRKSAASKKELKGKESIWLGKCLLERTKILSKVRHSETSSFFFLDASPVAQHLRTFCLCSQGNDRKHTEIKGVCWPSASVLVHGAAILYCNCLLTVYAVEENAEAALPTQISINDQGMVKVLDEKDLASDKLLKL